MRETALIHIGELHRRIGTQFLERDGKVGANVSPSLSLPTTARWKSGHFYVDHVELPPGRWDVDAQLIDPTPAAARKVLSSTPLGTFLR